MITLRQDKGSALTYEEVDNNFNSMMGGHNFLHIQDQKPEGTAGGTFTSGAWRTRDLNTVLTNTISGASLEDNQITLPAGKYYVEASAPARKVQRHNVRFQNITLNSTEVLGVNRFASETYNLSLLAFLSGVFLLQSTSVCELQHIAAVTEASYGFGIFNNFTTEVYSDIRIWRIGNAV